MQSILRTFLATVAGAPVLALAALGLSVCVEVACTRDVKESGYGEDNVNACHGYGYGYGYGAECGDGDGYGARR
jgi:hypothetical protein